MESARDTAGDVGTSISTSSEGRRQDLQAIASAAGHRATEAVRTLEELAKLESPRLAPGLESIRYGLYDLTALVEQKLPARSWPQWKVCVLLTESLCRHDWLEVAEAAIAGGADCIQLREKNMSTNELVARSTRLVNLARPHGVAVIVNDRVDVALAAEADGVHVGQDDLSVAQVRSMAGSRLLVGATVRTSEDIEHACHDGATYCGIGPMYPSSTKPDLVAAGLTRLRELLPELGPLPHLAIGGIDHTNVAEVIAAGGRGVAVCGAVCGSENPRAATERILEAVQHARTTEPVIQDA
jgi:thiamine-phosphate pyrophosphorylase